MLRISKLTDYAIIVLTAFGSVKQSLSAKQLVELTQFSLPTIKKITHILLQHDLLISTQGVKGGYQLAQAAQDIALSDVIQAMEGDLGITACSTQIGCQHASHCQLTQNWQYINRMILEVLSDISIENMKKPYNTWLLMPPSINQTGETAP